MLSPLTKLAKPNFQKIIILKLLDIYLLKISTILTVHTFAKFFFLL